MSRYSKPNHKINANSQNTQIRKRRATLGGIRL